MHFDTMTTIRPMPADLDVPAERPMQAQLFRVVYDKGARWKVDVWAEDPASAQQAVAYGFGVQSLDDVSVRIVGIIPMETNR